MGQLGERAMFGKSNMCGSQKIKLCDQAVGRIESKSNGAVDGVLTKVSIRSTLDIYFAQSTLILKLRFVFGIGQSK
jgi:hypothetical protein